MADGKSVAPEPAGRRCRGPHVAVVARSAADEWDRIIPYDRNQEAAP